MKWKIASLRTRLYLISAALLLTGLGSAILIYLTADNEGDSVSGYEVVGGYIYPGMHENSKKYIHDLEVYGGKAAVLADEFNHWFYGLWHGQTLAFTIACLTIFFSLVVFIAARSSASDPSDTPGEDKKTNTD
ncbi:MAG TPA: hypothetical protein VL122_01275 [Nitrospirota bacterium]|nr:hypothetical protein [Nitrospirota bacterium]